jgi:hypothetical protein
MHGFGPSGSNPRLEINDVLYRLVRHAEFLREPICALASGKPLADLASLVPIELRATASVRHQSVLRANGQGRLMRLGLNPRRDFRQRLDFAFREDPLTIPVTVL